MKRVIMILAVMALVAGLSVPTLAEGETPVTSSTYVTVTVVPAINEDIIDLAYTASYPADPSAPGTPDPGNPWFLGTLMPPNARTGGEQAGPSSVNGYLWAYRFQSNAAMRCTVSHEPVEGVPSLDALHNFLWQSKWTGSDLGTPFHPEPEDWVSDPLGPTDGSEWTFPNEVKFDMANPPLDEHPEANPWSVAAGDYMSKVKTTWTLSGTATSALAEPYGYVKVTVARAINADLAFGVGTSPTEPPNDQSECAALEVGGTEEDHWVAAVYPWILNFQTNAPSYNQVFVERITPGGDPNGPDIRRYMKHYAWTGTGFDEGHSMVPSGGVVYVYTGSAEPTMAMRYNFPNKVEIDLRGETTAGAKHRWMVQAGEYNPVGNSVLKFGFDSGISDSALALYYSIPKEQCSVIVRPAQDGYTLPEADEFTPVEVKPNEEATYGNTLTCHQNHDRNVWFTASGIADSMLTWTFEPGQNVEVGTAEDGEKWRGVFKYNSEGGASTLAYTVTYRPTWAVPAGDKALVITLNHTPAS